MRRPDRWWLVLAPLGVVMGLLAAVQLLRWGRPPYTVAADLLTGLVFLGAGLIAWDRRPDNRVGAIVTATAFAWWVGSYGHAQDVRVAYLADAFQGYYEPLLGWLILAYPTGRIATRAGRIVIGGWFLSQAAWSVTRLVLGRPLSLYPCPLCPETVDAYVANQMTMDAIGSMLEWTVVGFGLAVLILLVQRWLAASPPARRQLVPVVLGGFALAVAIATSHTLLLTDVIPSDVIGLVFPLTSILRILVAVGVLVGILRLRLARADVADLAVGLGGGVPAGGLRDVLARTLGDPSLDVLYPIPDGSGFVDSAGRPTSVPKPGAHRSVTPIGDPAAPSALLVSDPALTEADPGLVAAVGSVAGLALENSRLTAEVRAQLEDVRASRARIVEAGDAERRRVERDLHDGAQQRLVTLAVRLQLGRDALGDEADPATARLLDAASAELDDALAQLRELARGIHPAILAEAGLGPAIRSLAERSAVPVRVTASDERSPTRVETAAYYVVAEALTNVVRYAAASEATVSVERNDGVLRVRIADDGVGGADPERGSGLRGLEDRVAAVGGTLTVTSPPHAGTTILAEFPNA